MSGDQFDLRGSAKRGKPSQAQDPRGVPTSGRVSKMMFGQGHGFIRLKQGRDVYFHRSDMQEGNAFNDLEVDDAVTFELLEDAVSGARALRVRPTKKKR
jgi:cold shock CspA family protein